VCAEVLSLEEGLLLTKKRGKYMQEAVPAGVGAMAAIMKLGFEQVEEICAKAGAEAVNYNSPDQVVISGKRERVKEATKMALKLGAIVKELRVSGPFHSSLMKEAEERLKEDIKKVRFAKPLFPVVSTVSGEPEDDPQRIKELLTHQITAKVRWVDYIMKLKDLGISKIVEVGPGNVLTKLGKRITSQIKHLTFSEVVK
jgi:[acyl-carrier-protein] S-malonyltransferase